MGPTTKLPSGSKKSATRRVSGGWLLSLFLLVVTLSPAAAALTWTTGNADGLPWDTNNSVSVGSHSSYSVDDSTWIIAQHDDDIQDLVVLRTTNFGASWTENTVDTSPATNPNLHLDALGVDAYICYDEATTFDLNVANSHDSGLSWGVVTAVALTTESDGCGLVVFDSDTATLFYMDGTSFKETRTTDGGVVWGTPETLPTVGACTSSSAPDRVAGAAKDANNGAALIFCESSTGIRAACRTSNAGVDWTCSDIGLDGPTLGRMSHITGSTYIVAAETSTDNLGYFKTTNDGASWTVATAFSSAATEMITSVDMVVSDATTWGMVGCIDDTDAPTVGDALAIWATTTNAGETWSATEEAMSIESVDEMTACKKIGANLKEGVVFVSLFGDDTGVSANCADDPCTFVFKTSATFGTGGTLQAVTSASVTNLVGFDVDRTGSVVIARTDGGNMVRSFGATNLGTELDNFDTQCVRSDGVMAAQAHVGYLNCDVSAEVQELHIRNPSNLAQATFENCGNTSVCPMTVDLDEAGLCDGFTDRTVFGEVQEISFAPLNWSRVTAEETLSADDHAIAFSYATSTGFIGVAQFTANDDQSCDEYATERKSYTGAAVDQICTWESSGDEFIVAADQQAAVNVYTYVPAISNGILDGSMSDPSVYSSLFGSLAVDCAQDNFLVATGTGGTQTIRLFNAQTSSVIWTLTGIDSAVRGVALSNDGLWCSYVSSDTEGVICDATDGSTLCTFNMPGGTHKAIQLSARGQNLWVASSTTINQYSTFACTTGDPVSDSDPGLPMLTPTPSASGIFAGAGADIGEAFGVGSFGGNLFLGALLMGFVSFGVGTGGGALLQGERQGFRWSWGAAAVGAAVGFLMAWGFGFFSTAVVFSMVVLIGMTVAIRLWVNRG